MERQNELRKLNLLLKVIRDESVQHRFDTTRTCNMDTGKLSKERLIDECENYVINRINELIGED